MHTKPLVSIGLLTLTLMGFSAKAAIVETGSLWNKHQIRVCFAEHTSELQNASIDFKIKDDGNEETLSDLKLAPIRPDLKALIQKAVTDSFSLDKTGIEYIGWLPCSEGNYDLAVFYNMDYVDPNDFSGSRWISAGTIGKPADAPINTIRLNDSHYRGYYDQMIDPAQKDLLDWTSTPENELTDNWNHFAQYAWVKDVVHEFGHIAGLHHEQERYTLEQLKQYDITQDKTYSDDINDSVQQDAELLALLGPQPATKNFGQLNPMSTMDYFHNDYDLAAEKTRLICSALDQPNLIEWATLDFKELYGDLAGPNAPDYTADALKTLFCTDQGYIALHPKTQFDTQTLMDHQDQSALKSVYTQSAFEDLNAQELKNLDYIQNRWLKMTTFFW